MNRYVIFSLAIFISVSCFFGQYQCSPYYVETPKTFAYVANCWELECMQEMLPELSEFSGVILAASVILYPEIVQELRANNPDMTILIYIGVGTMPRGGVWEEIWNKVDPVWYVRKPDGDIIDYWAEGQHVLNYTEYCIPDANGKQWVDLLSETLIFDWLPLVPGVDGFMGDYFLNDPYPQWAHDGADIDHNGQYDHPYDIRKWCTAGNTNFVSKMRQLKPDIILLSNSDFVPGLNGVYVESFPQRQSMTSMLTHVEQITNDAVEPKISVVHLDNPNADYNVVKKAVALALLLDHTAASETEGPENHAQARLWPDLYHLTLGAPLNHYYSVVNDTYQVRADFNSGSLLPFQSDPDTPSDANCWDIQNGQLHMTNFLYTNLVMDCVTIPHIIQPGGNYSITFSYRSITPSHIFSKISREDSSSPYDNYLYGDQIFPEAGETGMAALSANGAFGQDWDFTLGIGGYGEVYIDDVTIQANGALLFRDFQKGTVAVNTTLDPQEINLGGMYFYPDGTEVEWPVVLQPDTAEIFLMYLPPY